LLDKAVDLLGSHPDAPDADADDPKLSLTYQSLEGPHADTQAGGSFLLGNQVFSHAFFNQTCAQRKRRPLMG